MSFSLEQKVVFISGGAGDIGSSIVKAFAREGARIVIGDLNTQAAEELKAELSQADITVLSLDVTSEASIQQAMEAVKAKYGRLDVLVNVAGILCRKSVFETQKSDFEQSMAVNVIGVFLLSRQAALLMKEQNSGSIINISSLNGSAAVENRVVYGATKAGLNMMAKSMALELGQFGITVNTVAPGVVDSKMCRVRLNTEEKISAFTHYIPLGRLTTPDDVAGSVLFLASPYASGITGEVLLVDGGIIARQALPR